MRRTLRSAALLTVLSALPTAAHAGWVSTWTNTAVKQNGDRLDPQNASMEISGGRVRLEQPNVITVIDYNNGQFTMINPTKQAFWSGTVDEYVRQMTQARTEKLQETIIHVNPTSKLKDRSKKNPVQYKPPTVDVAKLPPLSITKTAVTEKIAGYDTVKYEVRADGVLFQEIWVAPALDVSNDLNVDRYLALQRKMGTAMQGKSSGQYNALFFNDEYRKLIEKSFVLKVVSHHMGGGFERVATSMQQKDVPAGQFEVPDAYRKVNLVDVMEEPKEQPKGS